MRGARLVRSRFIDAHLDSLDLRIAVHPEDAFYAQEVLEFQPERRGSCRRRFREAHHSRPAPRRHREVALDLALIEAGKAPARVVDPRRARGRNGEQHRQADPAPVPRPLRMDRDARSGDAEALPDLEPSSGDVAHYGTTGGWSSARVSGRPNMRFMFCTAWPAAPFTRL